jgi:hypothetical protein
LSRQTEICPTPELLERILKLVGTDMILIGGRALAFWAAYYGIPAPNVAVTKDIDLLGTRDDVKRLARGLNGKAEFPVKNLITLLAGQVTKDLPDGNYINIDVLYLMLAVRSPNVITCLWPTPSTRRRSPTSSPS